MEDLQRQIRFSLFFIFAIIPIGVAGFHFIEGYHWLDAMYFTIITLSTIGYGDLSPESAAGKIFTLFLVIVGIGSFVYLGQAAISIVTSPILIRVRQKRRIQKVIDKLHNHYIICGVGEMVDKTVEYILQGSIIRRKAIQDSQLLLFDKWAARISKDNEPLLLFRLIRKLLVNIYDRFGQQSTILDNVVVVTNDMAYADKLRQKGLLIIEGDPTNDDVLTSAGLLRCQAVMVLLDSDMETLLCVLTAHNLARTLHITASVLDDDLSRKIVRVGANSVITPYATAGQFLNSATLRPAVSDFFNGLLFEYHTDYRMTQLELYDDSPWIGRSIDDLKLRDDYDAAVIGLRYDDARYGYAPDSSYVLQEDETLIVVAPADNIESLIADCRRGTPSRTRLALEQPLPFHQAPIASDKTYSLIDAEQAIQSLSKHFIICGDDRVARSSIDTLDPKRPFVIISNNNTLTSDLLKRGFRVVHGSPSSEDVLIKAGVKRAQAIMISLEDKADTVLAILNCRALNKRLLITTTAYADDMVDKLERAGADRVVSPFHVAARLTLLTTTRPKLAGFVQYVLFNYITGLETTEIYMEDDSVWIGKTITETGIEQQYNAGVLGIRVGNKSSFMYAPPKDYVIKAQEVLILVTPMKHSDNLREAAHASADRRPATLRNRVLQSTKWTPDQIQKLLQKAREERGE